MIAFSSWIFTFRSFILYFLLLSAWITQKPTLFFLDKNLFYKNVEAEMDQK